VKFKTVGLSYGALRKECLEAVRQWPGCESVAGIQILRQNRFGSFSVRITLYGDADVKKADRAIAAFSVRNGRTFTCSNSVEAASVGGVLSRAILAICRAIFGAPTVFVCLP